MPKFQKIIKLPGKTAQELYDVVAHDIGAYLEKIQMAGAKVTPNPEKKEVFVEGKMFSATLVCREGIFELDANLSLFAAPFKGKIEEGIERWITKKFPA